VSTILVVVQFKTVVEGLFAIAATGAVMFCVIVVLAVDVQPLVPVTVTV
jgi:hypothetical protein